jgi:hypothetical protein
MTDATTEPARCRTFGYFRTVHSPWPDADELARLREENRVLKARLLTMQSTIDELRRLGVRR